MLFPRYVISPMGPRNSTESPSLILSHKYCDRAPPSDARRLWRIFGQGAQCLYEAAAIHASDGDLVCVELDCAAALGAATSDAVAARPAALVAVATLVLCLYHYY